LPRNLITKSPPDPKPVPLPSCNSSAPSPIRPSPIAPKPTVGFSDVESGSFFVSAMIGLVLSPLRADPKEQGATYSSLFLCDCVFRPLSRVAVRKNNELSPTNVLGLRHREVRRPRQRKTLASLADIVAAVRPRSGYWRSCRLGADESVWSGIEQWQSRRLDSDLRAR
jgi:hypothetical protein